MPSLAGMETLESHHINWQAHRAYSYPPDILSRPIIRHLVPQFSQFIMVINTYKASSSQFSFAQREFDYCIKIGDYRSPAVITPTRRQWTIMVKQPYHRFYREASATYLFVKGYSYETVLEFRAKLRQHLYLRGSMVEKAAVLMLSKLRWSGRRLYEILE